MADPNMQFSPIDGHNNTDTFPTNPSKNAVRGLFQLLHDQTRDFINNVLIVWIKATFATKADLDGIVLGDIPDDSISAAKLSFDVATQDELDSHVLDYVRQPGYGVVTGSGNAYYLTVDPAPTSYVDGMCFSLNINVTNTATSTLNVNSLGAKTILDTRGNVLIAGKLTANTISTVRYNGNTGNFILQGEGVSGNATASDLILGKTATTDAGDIAGTMPNKVGSNTVINPSVIDQVIPKGYYSGALGDGKVKAITNVAGDNIAYKSPTVVLVDGTEYTKIKEWVSGYSGTVRINFKLKVLGNDSTGYGRARIYKNGVPYGTDRVILNSGTISYTEDLSFSVDDLIQIYAWRHYCITCQVENIELRVLVPQFSETL